MLSLPVASWYVREVFIGNVMNFTGPVNFSNFISFSTLRSVILYEVFFATASNLDSASTHSSLFWSHGF